MADNSSEFGEGRGRTGYYRDLRPHEQLRMIRATEASDAADTADAALVRELTMERRTRLNDAGLDLG